MSGVHLVQISLDARKVAKWATDCRLGDDLGYACHSLMCDAFGELRLQPFTAEEKMGRVKVLGYGTGDAAAMLRVMQEAAEPAVASCFLDVQSKSMPMLWEAGRHLSFRLRVAPTRQGKTAEGKAREADALLFEKGGADRETVYRTWLTSRIGGAAELGSMTMSGFQLMRAMRRSATGEGRRPAKAITLPDVIFEGTLRVQDPELFAGLISTGIGRHRAFGFGALMLRPARTAV